MPAPPSPPHPPVVPLSAAPSPSKTTAASVASTTASRAAAATTTTTTTTAAAAVARSSASIHPPPAAAAVAAAAASDASPHSQEPPPPPPAAVFCVEDDPALSAAQHMGAGALAGMTEHLAMFPVDTVKTRMQSYVAVRDFANTGMFGTTRAIVASEGLRALWRGVGAVALSAGPAHALYFATYEAVRERLAPGHRADGMVHAGATAVAGACATVVGDGVMTPLDVVKQRMQLAGRGVYGSVLGCARQVYESQGVGAFYAGYRATLLMNVPFTAVYFSGYEAAKKGIVEWKGGGVEGFSAWMHCLAGGLAGGMAAAATNPLDVVKTRLQTQGEVGARRYRGLVDAFWSIRVEEGIAGLMRGVKPRVLFHVPAAAVCWTTYEFCKHMMERGGVYGREGGSGRNM